MSVLCKLFDHHWVREHSNPLGEQASAICDLILIAMRPREPLTMHSYRWWIDTMRCTRCDAKGRDLSMERRP